MCCVLLNVERNEPVLRWSVSQLSRCGHTTPIELSHCTLAHCGHKPSEPSYCTRWPNKRKQHNRDKDRSVERFV